MTPIVRTHSLMVGLLALGLTSFIGCSTPDAGLAQVAGTVSLNGAPLANASVTFVPKDGTPGFGGIGKTDAAGRFTLVGSRDNAKGIPPGEYRVVISKRLLPDGTDVPADDNTPPMMSPAKESLPDHFSSMVATRLTASVPASGATLDFPLSTKRK